MNKTLKVIGALALFSIITFFYLLQSEEDKTYLDQAPGWFKHWLELKGNQTGEIPKGTLAKWVKEDQYLRVLQKKTESSFENIEEIGPTNVGGRTRSIIIDHSNPQRYLCAGVSGGIWESLDRGNSWSNIDDFGPTLSSTSIIQSPFDKDRFYYTTGETAGNSATLGGIGLFRSTDGAKSFQHLEHTMTDAFSGTWDVEHSKVFDSTIYVGTNNGGIWRSTDGGDSFNRIYSSSQAIHEIITYDDTTLMFSRRGVGIFTLNENTLETTALNGGDWPKSGSGRISFHYCRDFRDVLYAQVATSDRINLLGVYKSSDRGKTWTELTYPGARYNQAWYDFKLSVSPTDSNFVISTAVTPTYSNNGGQTWLEMANSHSDYHEITWEDDNQFLIGNDGGVYRMNKQSMSSFVDLNRGLNITQYYAGSYYPDGLSFIGGTQDNGTHLSFESNPFFPRINGGDGSFCAVDQQDDNVRYVSSQYLNITRQEVGQNNRRISNNVRAQVGGDAGVWFISPFEINLLDGNQIYIPTRSRAFRSLDGGFTWTNLTENTFGEGYSIGLSNEIEPTAYIGGTGSSLYRVDNAVTSEAGDEVRLWEPGVVLPPTEFLGSTIGCIEVDPNDKGTIYIGMTNINNRSRVWRVRNADTENPIYDPLGQGLPESLPVNWIELDPQINDHIIIGTDFGLYSSLNGGASWIKEEGIPNVPVHQVKLRDSDRKLFIFTHGRGIWTADLLENPVTSTEEIQPHLKNVSVYPNPVNKKLHIKGDFDSHELFDYSGNTISTSSENQISVEDLTPGIYFLRVKNEGIYSVKKIIITDQ